MLNRNDSPAIRNSRFEVPTLVIEPSRGWVSLKLGELWAYRELLYFLVWRDVKVRYKQTPLGAAWAFGIVIRMFYNDHAPVHFHAEYQGQRGKFDLTGRMIAGNIGSTTARRLIRQWARQHEAEIRANWQRVQTGKPLETIEPLR